MNPEETAPKPKQKFMIKFPVLLLIIFLLIQLVLFGLLDLRKYISGSAERTTPGKNSGDSASIQQILGAVLQTEQGPLVASDNNLTSVMIVGVDARNASLKNGEYVDNEPNGKPNTRNADSIMQVVLDHKTGNIFMISIPRDMGIDVRMDCFKFSGGIHYLYDKGQRSNCPEKGIGVLKNGVEVVTGIKVQYYVIISLDAFEDIINDVADTTPDGKKGIYVENDRSFSDLYPSAAGPYEGVYFPKGHLFLTPHRALQFARARQYTGDFDRAKRQQLVVQAVLKRALSTDILLDPTKLQSLIDTYNSKILMSTPKDLAELMAMFTVAKDLDLTKIHHIVLDPYFGNKGLEKYLNKQPHDRPGGPYYMVPTAWRQCPGNEFCKVQERIREYIADPALIP